MPLVQEEHLYLQETKLRERNKRLEEKKLELASLKQEVADKQQIIMRLRNRTAAVYRQVVNHYCPLSTQADASELIAVKDISLLQVVCNS